MQPAEREKSAPCVEFHQVSKSYSLGPFRGEVRALEDVSFRVEPGEVFGLFGPNRAGKTTLVKVLLSLCAPTAGRITRFGRPARDRRTLARIGYMHENHAFPRYLTARGLLEYYGALSLVPYEVVCHRVPRLLERVGLADRAGEPVARFSKGMVQRLGLAQALINDPDLLVLDEPTEGLDLAGRQLLYEVIAQQRDRGRSVLLISHALAEVEPLIDRAGVLVGGHLVHAGPLPGLSGGPGGTRCLEHALRAFYLREAA